MTLTGPLQGSVDSVADYSQQGLAGKPLPLPEA